MKEVLSTNGLLHGVNSALDPYTPQSAGRRERRLRATAEVQLERRERQIRRFFERRRELSRRFVEMHVRRRASGSRPPPMRSPATAGSGDSVAGRTRFPVAFPSATAFRFHRCRLSKPPGTIAGPSSSSRLASPPPMFSCDGLAGLQTRRLTWVDHDTFRQCDRRVLQTGRRQTFRVGVGRHPHFDAQSRRSIREARIGSERHLWSEMHQAFTAGEPDRGAFSVVHLRFRPCDCIRLLPRVCFDREPQRFTARCRQRQQRLGFGASWLVRNHSTPHLRCIGLVRHHGSLRPAHPTASIELSATS